MPLCHESIGVRKRSWYRWMGPRGMIVDVYPHSTLSPTQGRATAE